MKSLLLALACCLLTHLVGTGCSKDEEASEASPSIPHPNLQHGLSLLHDLRLLPLSPRQTITRQVSSHSRDGGNTDFGNYGPRSGRETYLYKEDGMNVVLDEHGPGCINRIWITTPFIETIDPVQIFMDRMDEPVVELSAKEFFSGEVSYSSVSASLTTTQLSPATTRAVRSYSTLSGVSCSEW